MVAVEDDGLAWLGFEDMQINSLARAGALGGRNSPGLGVVSGHVACRRSFRRGFSATLPTSLKALDWLHDRSFHPAAVRRSGARFDPLPAAVTSGRDDLCRRSCSLVSREL